MGVRGFRARAQDRGLGLRVRCITIAFKLMNLSTCKAVVFSNCCGSGMRVHEIFVLLAIFFDDTSTDARGQLFRIS